MVMERSTSCRKKNKDDKIGILKSNILTRSINRSTK